MNNLAYINRKSLSGVPLLLAAIVIAMLLPDITEAKGIRFDESNTTHIIFDKISANTFEVKPDSLKIIVDSSASFLLMPYEQVKPVHSVTFLWSRQGELKIRDAAHEQTRNGDDAYVRIGLMIEGEPEFYNPMTPKWLQTVNATLHHASNKMIYLVPGSHNDSGKQWQSPYSANVDVIAISSEVLDSGWTRSSHVFDKPVNIVGLWIMADGDDTHSTFVSQVKELVLE